MTFTSGFGRTGLLNYQSSKWKVIVIIVFLPGLETESSKWSKNTKTENRSTTTFTSGFGHTGLLNCQSWKWKVVVIVFLPGLELVSRMNAWS